MPIVHLSLLTKQEPGLGLSSELGKVKTVRKRTSTPPHLYHRQYKVAL